jgi:hypothetical protein
MILRTWHYYDAATGVLTGQSVSHSNCQGLDAHIEATTPAGLKAIEGAFDYLSQRVDVATGGVVDHQPPPPSPDHEWDAGIKRWKLNQASQDRQAKRVAAQARIGHLADDERHLVRQLLLAATAGPQSAPIAKARAGLQAIDDEIAQHLAHLTSSA